MKCPRCWAEKAYLREVRGWRGVALACLLLKPLKCHHCYHKFTVPGFLTWGKQLAPPVLRIAAETRSAGTSYAAQHHGTRIRRLEEEGALFEDPSQQAKAA